MTAQVAVIGGGLAGCEAALWLAKHDVPVTLYEQKPTHFSPAHKADGLAELVCSNSFKAKRLNSAGGLLKEEMRLMGSALLPIADETEVPAGGALAVDRHHFSARVTEAVQTNPLITVKRQEVTALNGAPTVLVASGPLTSGKLADAIAEATGEAQLSFYDAAAPIISADSINRDEVFSATRYGRGDADYINCPFDKAGYDAFISALQEAETAPLKAFDENPNVYEACVPVEVLAKRGADTLRFGPLRPVGLTNPHTGRRPWANVQLRQEDDVASMYNIVGFQTNLKFGEQQRVFRMVPGLQNAEFVRYGVMHRNTFINTPAVLKENLAMQTRPDVFFAGQITGFEGYMESAACGLLAAHAILAAMHGKSYKPPPQETMCGALVRYVTAPNVDFQPMGANMGLLPPLDETIKDKRERYMALAQRGVGAMERWLTAYNHST